MHRVLIAAVTVSAAVCSLASCSSRTAPVHQAHRPVARSSTAPAALTSPASSPSVVRPVRTVTPHSSTPAPTHSSLRTSTTTSAPSDPPRPQLPRGGRHILPRYRVVAYYGGPDGPTLGVLGSAPPDEIANRIARRARQYRPYGRPVLPAMELIADVAQGSPGPDGDYSAPIGADQIQRYLDAAHAHRMLLILDIQPGSGDFLTDAKALRRFVLDPSVGLALDPEWKVPPGEAPGGGRIGSATADSINAVGRWLSRLVRRHHLPDKLLIVHQFALSMLPDRQRIHQHRGLDTTLHADGEGPPAEKVGVFHQLAFPSPPFYVGFKLFFTEDTRLMSPAEVMALHPRPDVITYQ